MRRSQSRVLMISKMQIEKKMEKLKKRLNRIYVEILAHEDALKLFSSDVKEKLEQEEVIKEKIVGEKQI